MKLNFFIMLIAVLQVSANHVSAQKTRLDLKMKDASLAKILDAIEEQSEVYFFYNKNQIDENQKVDVDFQNKTIEEALNNLSDALSITYEVVGKNIIIKPRDSNEPVVTQQPKSISGEVTDSSGSPLPGVTIVIKGTSNGTITDANGHFSLPDVPPGATLLFSFVGMKTQELPVSGKTVIHVMLAEETIGMEEVVVVGYGVQKKINLTGSVASVSSEELADRPVTSVAQAMQGLVPNLQITTTDGGRPGASLSWQIRGTGSIGGASDSPLILIDGVAAIGGAIDNLNPEDIESISVLKDAAASAIYGSRAPYGVVLVTTKKGKSEQMKVTVNSSLSWRQPTKMLNTVGSADFMNYFNESMDNLGLNPYFDQAWVDSVQYRIDHPEKNLPNSLVNPANPAEYYRQVAVDTDWWAETYKNNALTQNYNINASGGTKKATYYTSLGYMDQDGLYRHGDDYFKRYTGLLNLNVDATKWLELGFKIQLSRSISDTPNTDDLEYMAIRERPIHPIKEPTGQWSAYAYPFHIAEEGGRRNTNKDAFSNTISFVIKPLKDFRINGDATFNSYDERYTENSKVLYKYNALGEIRGTQTGANTSYIRKQYSMNKYYAGNLYADYMKQLNSHYFYILAGTQLEYNHFFRLNGYRDNLLNEDILSLNAAVGENLTISDNENEWSNKGYFFRFNYNYLEKYLIEFNGRYDGSSRFPGDLRWGFFPSVSAGYNITKESWFEPITKVVNTMKLRASYGTLGNSNVDEMYYSATMSKLKTDYTGPDGTFLEYISAPGLGNYYLTWEKPTTLNLALDLAMFKNRLQTSFDWYRRKTVDMIGPSQPLPKVLGVNVPKANNTEMKGTGWEFTLLYRGVAKDFKYQATLNVSRHREEVTKYYNPEGLFTTYYEGKILGEIWGYETAGIINDTETLTSMANQSQISSHKWALGDIQYKDQLTVDTDGDGIPDAGDGKITRGSQTLDAPGDLIRIGNTRPDYEYNINLECGYKGFDLRMFFRGMGHTDWWPADGQGTYAATYTENLFFGNSFNYWNPSILVEHLDHWTPETPNAYYPRVLVYNNTNVTYKNRQKQTKYLQNRAFIRLKNVQLGYTLPPRWTKPYLVQNARFYVSGENLLTFTKLRIFDPETPGLIYPLQKVFSAGVKITF